MAFVIAFSASVTIITFLFSYFWNKFHYSREEKFMNALQSIHVKHEYQRNYRHFFELRLPIRQHGNIIVVYIEFFLNLHGKHIVGNPFRSNNFGTGLYRDNFVPEYRSLIFF
jgi:hypothetical protein